MRSVLMNKIKPILALLLLLSFVKYSNAQLKTSFIKATIVLQNGDSLIGYIKEAELSKLNYSISYKTDIAGTTETVYDTTQVRSFQFENGELFELLQFRGHVMTSPVHVFAKTLVKGKASLYKIVYHNDDLFLITNNGQTYVMQDDKQADGPFSTELTHYYFKDYLAASLAGSSYTRDRLDKTSFREKDFREIVTGYNTQMGVKSKSINETREAVHFVIACIGGMVKDSKNQELFAQVIYRTYLPKISSSTSINFGLGFYYYKHLEKINNYSASEANYISKLYSLPVQFQQNILNKKVRPYIFLGADLSYLQVENDKGVTINQKGFQSNFGVGIIYGGGLEIDIAKGLMVKGEYRYEVFSHLVLAGISYRFSKQ